uniref:Uncharacterized protein n=1 Tax=Oryza punctata TaxID=4537 RepID=A0A0E0MLV1_ORYPU
MASLNSVHEIATAVAAAGNEAPMEQFMVVTDAAMGVLSPAGDAAKSSLDRDAGALNPGVEVSYDGKSGPRYSIQNSVRWHTFCLKENTQRLLKLVRCVRFHVS